MWFLIQSPLVLVVSQPPLVLETLDPLSGLLAVNGGKLTSLLGI